MIFYSLFVYEGIFWKYIKRYKKYIFFVIVSNIQNLCILKKLQYRNIFNVHYLCTEINSKKIYQELFLDMACRKFSNIEGFDLLKNYYIFLETANRMINKVTDLETRRHNYYL